MAGFLCLFVIVVLCIPASRPVQLTQFVGILYSVQGLDKLGLAYSNKPKWCRPLQIKDKTRLLII